MRSSIVLVLAASSAWGQLYSANSDIRRGQLLAQCLDKFASIKEQIVTDGPASSQTEAGMDICNKRCKAENSKDREAYLSCFSCCDMYFGQTPRAGSATVPLVPTFVTGQRPVDLSATPNAVCNFITFPTPFPPGSENRLHVEVSLAHSRDELPRGSSYNIRAGSVAWIESITNQGFQACAQRAAGTANGASGADAVINWLAVSDDDDSQGAAGMHRVTQGLSGVACKEFAYGKKFDDIPAVLLTVNHRSRVPAVVHDPVASWISSITKASFTACVRERAGRDDSHDVLDMDFVAITEAVKCPGYMLTGNTKGTKLQTLFPAVATETARCVRIPFSVAFPVKPMVFSSLISPTEGLHWIESVFTDSFIQCADKNLAGALDWNNISFQYFAVVSGATAEDCYRK